MTEHVILVDEQDNETGTMEKMEAHVKGELHRAFSVLIFNSTGELLLQRRSDSKYHSAGLWTNACCSHPRPNEEIVDAAKRRLREEMGLELSPEISFKFIYRTSLENGLTEHELDYVLVGISDQKPVINSDEVQDWKYVSMDELKNDIYQRPELYTYWFKQIVTHPELGVFKPV